MITKRPQFLCLFLLLPRLPIDEDSSTEEAGICFIHEIFDIVPLESNEGKGEGIKSLLRRFLYERDDVIIITQNASKACPHDCIIFAYHTSDLVVLFWNIGWHVLTKFTSILKHFYTTFLLYKLRLKPKFGQILSMFLLVTRVRSDNYFTTTSNVEIIDNTLILFWYLWN